MKKLTKTSIGILICSALLTACSNTGYDLYGFKIAKWVNCSGDNAVWETCYKIAAANCPSGYKILRQNTQFQGAQGAPALLSSLVYTQMHGKDSIKQMTYECNKP